MKEYKQTTQMKYKKINVILSDGTLRDESVNSVFELINAQFDEAELRVVKTCAGFEIWLRELSMDRLDQVVTDLSQSDNCVSEVAQKLSNSVKGVKSYGLKGLKRVFVDYNKERKVEGRREKEEHRGRHYYTNGAIFDTKSNDVPERFNNQILCGDSEDILKKFPENCIDLVFTSPPYNFGLKYEGQDDASSWKLYFEKLFSILDECIRVLKYGGRLVINIQPLYSDYIPSHHIISKRLMNSKLIWKGEILWEKNNYNCKYTAWGSWKSPSNPYLKYTWEFLEIFCKGTLRKQGDSSNADISAEDFKNWVVGKWSIAPERKMKEFDHPAMFPEELARRVIQLFSFKNDTVLDPFVGVGTSCVVAKKFGRSFVGIDTSAQYCETAKDRLQEIMYV